MKKFKYIVILFLLINIVVNAQKIEKTSITAEKVIKMYVDNYITHNEIIGVHIYNDSTNLTTSTTWVVMEALPSNYKFLKKTPQYKWFKYNKADIIMFCGFSDNKKCSDFFNNINLNKFNSSIDLLDKEANSYILDYKVKTWYIGINNEGIIDNVNGTFIESEVSNPQEFKGFLRKYSSLKLYQLYEGGEIIKTKKKY